MLLCCSYFSAHVHLCLTALLSSPSTSSSWWFIHGVTMTSMASTAATRLILVNTLYTIGRGVSDLFLSIYLYRLKPDIHTLAIVSLATFISVGIILPPFGYVIKRVGAQRVHVMGAATSALFYASLLYLADDAAYYLTTIGILQGMNIALISLAGHVMVNEVVVDESSRAIYLNHMGTIKALADFGCPLVAGMIATRMGYYALFVISLLCFVASAIACLTLSQSQQQQQTTESLIATINNGHSTDTRSSLSPLASTSDKTTASTFRLWPILSHDDPSWRALLLAYLFVGLRDGLYGPGRTLLMWHATGGETKMGSMTAIISLVNAITFAAATRWMNGKNKQLSFMIGVIGMTISSLLLAAGSIWFILMLHSIGIAIATPFWSTSMQTASMTVMNQVTLPPPSTAASTRVSTNNNVEMICAREIPLAIGRIALLSLFIMMTSSSSTSTLPLQLLLAASSLSFPAVYYCYNPPAWARSYTYERTRSKSV
jgi:YQGE family putative transporter